MRACFQLVLYVAIHPFISLSRFLSIVINRYKYAHVNEAEAEEMKFDEAYKVKSGVHREDVKRILSLPKSLNMAMPFLFNLEEIEMHRLLLKYTYGRGEEYYTRLDAKSQNTKGNNREYVLGRSAVSTGAYNMSMSERSLNNDTTVYYLKGRECDMLRAVNCVDATEECLLWQAIDAVLSPELYDEGVGEADDAGTKHNKDSGVVEAGSKVLHSPAIFSEPTTQLSDENSYDRHVGGSGGSDDDDDDNHYTEMGCARIQEQEKAVGRTTVEPATNPFGEGKTDNEQFPLNREQLLELYIHSVEDIRDPLEREVRSLLDKYYVPLELAALGRERRAATKALTDEVMIVAESLRMAEQNFERQLISDPSRSLEDPPWLSEGIGLKTLDFVAIKLGVGIQARNLMHVFDKEGSRPSGEESGSEQHGNEIIRANPSAIDERGGDFSLHTDNGDGLFEEHNQRRIWGSWEVCHPAAVGIHSQQEAFPWDTPGDFDPGKRLAATSL